MSNCSGQASSPGVMPRAEEPGNRAGVGSGPAGRVTAYGYRDEAVRRWSSPGECSGVRVTRTSTCSGAMWPPRAVPTAIEGDGLPGQCRATVIGLAQELACVRGHWATNAPALPHR